VDLSLIARVFRGAAFVAVVQPTEVGIAGSENF
jgi:hypothetical protein